MVPSRPWLGPLKLHQHLPDMQTQPVASSPMRVYANRELELEAKCADTQVGIPGRVLVAANAHSWTGLFVPASRGRHSGERLPGQQGLPCAQGVCRGRAPTC